MMMKICNKHGNGVCLNCTHEAPDGYGDICRYTAEEMLDLLAALISTQLTDEQRFVIEDFITDGDFIAEIMEC